MAPITTRPRRTCCSSRTAASASAASRSSRCGVLLEQDARLGQCAVARRAVEQLVAELVLEPPDRLADRRLGAMEPLGRLRKAAVRRRRRRKRSRSCSCITYIISNLDIKSKTINWTQGWPSGYNCNRRTRCLPTGLRSSTRPCATASRRPGFSMRIDEKLKLARQLATLGVDIIEAGFPIASEADAEAVRTIATQVQGPVIAGAGALQPGRHRSRRRSARRRRRAAASTSSSPRRICTSSASCA